MRFNLRQMEVFRAVMMAGSMSGAARLLNVSQPAVSRIIAYTEQRLGLRLFERVNGRLVPTAEAGVLDGEVRKLFDEARHVDALAQELVMRPGGTLAIAASPSLSLHFIPGLIARFLRAYPQVHVRYHTALLAEMPRELLSGKASLAISVMPVDDPSVTSEPFVQGRLVCILPAGHPLAGAECPGLAELAPHPMVMYNRQIPFGRMISRAFEDAGLTLNPVIEIPRAELAIALVRAGIGYALVDEFALGKDALPGIVVRPLAEPIHMTLSLLQPRFGTAQTQPARNFIQMLREDVAGRAAV